MQHVASTGGACLVHPDIPPPLPHHPCSYNLATVEKLYHAWGALMPRVRPCYAVKCNPDEGLLAVLAALGAGFDCASEAEMAAVMALGVAPDRIIYAHPCKPPKQIRWAASHGVNLTTFDTESELHKVCAGYWGGGGPLCLAPRAGRRTAGVWAAALGAPTPKTWAGSDKALETRPPQLAAEGVAGWAAPELHRRASLPCRWRRTTRAAPCCCASARTTPPPAASWATSTAPSWPPCRACWRRPPAWA